MTAFPVYDDYNGDHVRVEVTDHQVSITGDSGRVTISHHTLAAIFEASNGHRLAHVAELDPKTDGHAMLANVDRARNNIKAAE